jgi:fructose-1,6-bisphosphatase/inositol monophosphatase family enzyme
LTDWLALCREAVDDVRHVLAELPTRADREPVVGAGEGGDETTAIDQAAERAVLARFDDVDDVTFVSEEVGTIGDGRVHVVIDPIDGSLNAKRGIGFFALSVAVASGPTMGPSSTVTCSTARGRRTASRSSRSRPRAPPRSPRRRPPSSTSPTACGSWGRSRCRSATSLPAASTPSAR